MMAARKILGTALAICTIGIAATLGSTAHAQGMTAVPLPSTSKARANAKPTITGNPSRMLVAGSYYDFRPSASDPDSAQLNFAINKKPRWANFDASSGRLYGTPSAIDVGKIKGIQISVSDGVNRKGLAKFGIKVMRGVAPTISGAPATTRDRRPALPVPAERQRRRPAEAAVRVVSKPSWASFDSITGRLHGTPPAGSAGTYSGITISVTDGATTVEPRAVCDHRGEGCVRAHTRTHARGQLCTDHQRHAALQRAGRPDLRLHSERQRQGRRHADLLVGQHPGVAHLRPRHRPPHRQAAVWRGDHLYRPRDLGERRHGHRVPRSVLGHCGAGPDQQVAGAERRAVDQRHAADQRQSRASSYAFQPTASDANGDRDHFQCYQRARAGSRSIRPPGG